MYSLLHSQRNVVVFNLMGVFRHNCRDSCEMSSYWREGRVTHRQDRRALLFNLVGVFRQSSAAAH